MEDDDEPLFSEDDDEFLFPSAPVDDGTGTPDTGDDAGDGSVTEPSEDDEYLFDGEPFSKPTDLFYSSRIIVAPSTIRRSAHGVTYEWGEPAWCWCSLEGREQQAGMFSISGSEDKSPQSSGGLREVTVKQIQCREWHGDIHSFVWIDGDLYDVDGAPEHREHGRTHHWEIRARRAADMGMIPEEFRLRPKLPADDAPVWGESKGVLGWYESGSTAT